MRFRRNEVADPDVAAGILKQSCNIVLRQPIAHGVPYRAFLSKLLETAGIDKPVEAIACGNPPISQMVSQDRAISAPTRICDCSGKIRPDAGKVIPDQPMDSPPVARHIQISSRIVKDRTDFTACEPVRVAVAHEAGTSQSHRS